LVSMLYVYCVWPKLMQVTHGPSVCVAEQLVADSQIVSLNKTNVYCLRCEQFGSVLLYYWYKIINVMA
jgi:hypothetical protein